MEIYIDVGLCTKHLSSEKKAVNKDGRLKMRKLEWDLMLHTSSDEEKETLNLFRLAYAKDLIEHLRRICGNNICKPNEVGTTVNRTVYSDIDINLNFNRKSIQEDMGRVMKVYDALNNFHFSRFKRGYSEMFDINVYGTTFDISSYVCSTTNNDYACITQLDTDVEQRHFARGRIARICKWDRREELEETRLFLDRMGTKVGKKSYPQHLRGFMTVSPNDIGRASHMFSMSKLLENDTYWSIGAYLHIVVGRQDLSRTLYVDSMLDNLGFVVKSLHATIPCAKKIPLSFKMLRVAKYMARILDAYHLGFLKDSHSTDHSNGRVLELCLICENLNMARKKGDIDTSHVRGLIGSLLKKVGVSNNHNKPQQEPTLFNVERAIVRYVFSLLVQSYPSFDIG